MAIILQSKSWQKNLNDSLNALGKAQKNITFSVPIKRELQNGKTIA